MILPNSYISIVRSMIGFIIVFVLIFPYIQAEIFTSLNSDSFDIKKICKTNENLDFKYIKIINFEKQKNTSTVNCIYKDYNKNTLVTLYSTEDAQWLIEYTRNYKKDIGFFWPIYY